MSERSYFVYIVASISKVLYVGSTSELSRRVYQHKTGYFGGFTARYHANRLVYFEALANPRAAASRERELKGWLRDRKMQLVEQSNPAWLDLAEGWYSDPGPAPHKISRAETVDPSPLRGSG